MIKLEKVCKKYKNFIALDEVNLEMKKGEIYGLLGHNGAGKTTTLKAIIGLLNIDSGNIHVDNDIKIGYMPEAPVFYEHLTLKEYMDFISEDYKYDNLIELVGLKKFMNKKISNFSKGMKQRAAFACSLTHNPDILLLDEPLSALDPEGRKDVINIIKGLKDEGKTIMISTHILSDVENICDCIGILKNGKLIFEDSLIELKKGFIYPIVDICVQEISSEVEFDSFKFVDKFTYENNCYSFFLNDIRAGKREILKSVIENDIEIISVNQRKSSLEDIYLEMINGGEKSD